MGEQGRVFEDKATLVTPVCPCKIDLLRVSECPSLGVDPAEVGRYPLLPTGNCITLRGKNFSKAVFLQL